MVSRDYVAQLTEALKPTIGQLVDEMIPDPFAGEKTMATATTKNRKPDDDAVQYQKFLGRKFAKYSRVPGKEDFAGATQFMDSLDDEDRDSLHKYMEACDDEAAKAMYAKMMTGQSTRIRNFRQGQKQRYAKGRPLSDLERNIRAREYHRQQLAKGKSPSWKECLEAVNS